MTALIEKSVRLALRYTVNLKSVSTEDLYKCKLVDLDVAYKELNRQLKDTSEDGLSDVKTQLTEQLELRREVIKYVYATLTSEATEREANRKKLANNSKLKQQLLESIEDDDLTRLKSLSKEEKIKMLEQLG
jgi:Zn-finger protein